MKNLNAKNNQKNKPEIPGKVKKGYRAYVVTVLCTYAYDVLRCDCFCRR